MIIGIEVYSIKSKGMNILKTKESDQWPIFIIKKTTFMTKVQKIFSYKIVCH